MTRCADRYLSEQDVLALARSAGIELARSDLAVMTTDLNGLIDGLDSLAAYSEDLPCEGERDLHE